MGKTGIFLMAVLATTCITENIEASWQDIVFTENAIIQDGDQYIQVAVREVPPNTTTIEMIEGKIGTLFVYDYSTVSITGGHISGQFYAFDPENNDGDTLFRCPSEFSIYVSDHSTVNISGGSIDSVKCENWSTLNITGGDVDLTFSDHSVVNISGGNVNFSGAQHHLLGGENYSHLYISGGNILGSVLLENNSTMEIYGYGFEYDPDGGEIGNPKITAGGSLTGSWQDSTPFNIDFRDFGGTHSYDNVVLHMVPEPTTSLLLGLGIVLSGKRGQA